MAYLRYNGKLTWMCYKKCGFTIFYHFFSVITNPWTGEPINVANEGNDENSAHDGKSEFLDILTFFPMVMGCEFLCQ